ncbi:unnamed protein product [Schistosoma curassoni]|uniref:Retrotransposon protein n=1 Tax=Schistosoma curassoni TaxID=6186 RepID=A0A183KDA7_9TREM|nr:unnamed protein product [Schistosoma curassoni]
MEPVMERLDINSNFDTSDDYVGRFEIWTMTEEDIEDVNSVAHFLTLIGVEAYSLIKTYPDKPISLRYATLNELLLDHVKCTKFECGKEENFRKMICQGIKNYTTLLRRPILMRNQGYSDNNSLRSCGAGHEDEHEFDPDGGLNAKKLRVI